MTELDFTDISFELRGALAKGRLKSTDSSLVFKSSKTGKIEQVSSDEIDTIHWHRFAGHWGIRIFTNDGSLVRFGGFRDNDKEKLTRFFSNRFSKTMVDMDFCYKGWNWGTAKFKGSVLSFEVGNALGFDLPLSYVSQCTTGKNEVTLEFHQHDDAEVSLMELRFHMPSGELAAETEPVDAFKEQVLRKADIISAIGDAIAIFREVQCLTPRGRYDIKVFQSFFQLHGKTFDYKIPMSTVLRLFLLPHKDGRQMFFVISLDPPIKQGQTRYHYLVFLFTHEEECAIELPLTEDELESKYEGKLTKDISGPTYEVVSKIMKVLINRKITGPGKFMGHTQTPAVACSYKAAAGYIYPLERGFMFVHKPPLHIRFEEITGVNFARGGGTTRSFDFEVETKSGVIHTFSSIEKEEYPRMFDFINNKKLRIKNSGKLDKPAYLGDYENSEGEEEPDAYLARVKAEAEERSDQGDSEEGSEDEDYNPDAAHVSDVAEEFDSNASASSESGSGESDGEGGVKKKKEKKPKTRTVREGTRGDKTKIKRKKDKDEPKRPVSAYMLFLNANRDAIKAKYPEISMIEISKKGGEMWRELADKSEWEEKYKKLKEEYKKLMQDYTPAAGSGSPVSKKRKASSPRKKPDKPARSNSKKETPTGGTSGGSGAGFKSKEFISDSEGSGSEGSEGGKKGKTKGKAKAKPKKKESDEESASEVAESESE